MNISPHSSAHSSIITTEEADDIEDDLIDPQCNESFSDIRYSTSSYARTLAISDQVDEIITGRFKEFETTAPQAITTTQDIHQLAEYKSQIADELSQLEAETTDLLATTSFSEQAPIRGLGQRTANLGIFTYPEDILDVIPRLSEALARNAELREEHEYYDSQEIWLSDISDSWGGTESRKTGLFNSLRRQILLSDSAQILKGVANDARSEDGQKYTFVFRQQSMEGIMSINEEDNFDLNIDYLATHPKNIGGPEFSEKIKGVGKTLIRHAERIVRHDRSKDNLTLMSKTPSSHKFYCHMGFKHDSGESWTQDELDSNEVFFLYKPV